MRWNGTPLIESRIITRPPDETAKTRPSGENVAGIRSERAIAFGPERFEPPGRGEAIDACRPVARNDCDDAAIRREGRADGAAGQLNGAGRLAGGSVQDGQLLVAVDEHDPSTARRDGQNADRVCRDIPRTGRFGGRGMDRLDRVQLSGGSDEKAIRVAGDGERGSADRLLLPALPLLEVPRRPAFVRADKESLVVEEREGVDRGDLAATFGRRRRRQPRREPRRGVSPLAAERRERLKRLGGRDRRASAWQDPQRASVNRRLTCARIHTLRRDDELSYRASASRAACRPAGTLPRMRPRRPGCR